MYILANLMVPAYDTSVQATPSRFDARVSFWSRKAASVSLHATGQSTIPHRMRCFLQQDESLVPAVPRVGWFGGHREGRMRQSRVRDVSRSAMRALHAREKRRQGQDVNMWKQGWQKKYCVECFSGSIRGAVSGSIQPGGQTQAAWGRF